MSPADKMARIAAIVKAYEEGENPEGVCSARFALGAIRNVLDEVPSCSGDDAARLTRELADLWSRLRELEPYEHLDNTMTCRKVREAMSKKFKELCACLAGTGPAVAEGNKP